MDPGAIALIAVLAGVAGGAVGGMLSGIVRDMLRTRRGWATDPAPGTWQFHGTYRAQPPPMRPGAAQSPFRFFNDRAKRTLALAQDEAVRFNHRYIGPEHVLLGLAREGEGVAARSLDALGATLSKLRVQVEASIGRGTTTAAPSEITLSDTTKAAFALAEEERVKLGHHEIATEHLLLGLVREGGAAMALLRSLGIDPERVRHQVIAGIGARGVVLGGVNLDPHSRRVLASATQEAIQSGHAYVGSENLAMALRLAPTLEPIWNVLAIDSDVLRKRIEAVVPPTLGVVPTEATLTPRVGRILALAGRAAATRDSEMIAPEHILIALVEEGGGVGAQTLASLGATAERVRATVDQEKP